MSWCWLLLLFVFSTAVSAQPEDILQQAINSYEQAQQAENREQRLANFQQAERLFAHALAQTNANADLYINLGTAALQSERLGAAILAYRRALELDPDNARAQQNLLHARKLLPAWVPTPEQTAFDSFFLWHRSWAIAERAGAAAVSFLLAAFILAVAVTWRMAALRNLALLPGVLWAALLISVAFDYWSDVKPQAVIVVAEAVARAADSINAPVRFAEPLPEGTEVTVLETRDRWAKIALAHGGDAWINQNQLELINTANTQ